MPTSRRLVANKNKWKPDWISIRETLPKGLAIKLRPLKREGMPTGNVEERVNKLKVSKRLNILVSINESNSTFPGEF